MFTTYEQVSAVLSQPPSSRKDFEVLDLLPWFRKKSEIFKDLQQEFLVELIKHVKFVTKQKDELIIKQGDVGHCMYILLRGQVTIYMLYPKKGTDASGPNTSNTSNENIRQNLGDFVCNLGPGETFGEVALQSESDSFRTASIIANETTDLIEVDRTLYNSTVKGKLQKDFEDKVNFINSHPYFKAWVPRYRKQLAMALRKESYAYNSVLIRQGDHVDDIYYILSGEVKITVDPDQHPSQYPKIMEGNHRKPPKSILQKTNSKQSLNGTTRENDDQSSMSPHSKLRARPAKKQILEVSLLQAQEAVGDIEVLLDLPTSIWTATCTHPSKILILEMKHYDRIISRRNPRTIEQLRLSLLPRLRLHYEQIPLMESLCWHVFRRVPNTQVQQVQSDQQQAQERTSKQPRTQAQLFESFIPPPGPVIDMYGPGTVFHRIRQREEVKRMKARGTDRRGLGMISRPAESMRASLPNFVHTREGESSTTDPNLAMLEGKVKEFLQGGSIGGIGGSQAARVTRFHRSSAERDAVPRPPIRSSFPTT